MVTSIYKLTFFKRSFWRNVFLAIMLEGFGRIKTPNALNCTELLLKISVGLLFFC